jgi:uncharacterized membrane protein YidH (DUF202 family)
MDFTNLISPEIKNVIKIFAILINLGHIFVAITLANFINGVSKQVRTANEGFFKFWVIVHVGLIIAILLMIIFLF